MEVKSPGNMSAHPDNTERKKYLPLLWDVFLEKIDGEWKQKYAHLGLDRYAIESTTQLANAVYQDLQIVNNEYRRSSTLTNQVIHKYLNKDGFPQRIRPANLQVILLYCDYEDWQEFIDAVELDSPSSTRGEQAQKNDKGKNNSFRNPWHYLGPVVLVLPFISFFLA